MPLCTLRRPASALVFSVAFTLIACAENSPTVETVFPQNSAQCLDRTIANQFIVHWKNGQREVFKSYDRETLIKTVVQPQLEQIRRVDYDRFISFSPELTDLKPEPAESDPSQKVSPNWGIGETKAEVAWQRGIRGKDVLIAVVDSGVDYAHPRLANQVAINPGESGFDDNGQDKRFNNIDDDGNGFVDDYYGYNFAYNDGDPSDLIKHGTHVAGIIAAEHYSNHISYNDVQGVAPGAKILPIAFIGNSTGGEVSDALDALDYAALRGADIINASWGGVGCAPSLGEKIIELGQKGILFVSAAGNSGLNIDRRLEYPASFGLENQITVGSIGREGGMASHSNYGTTHVNLFAPGYKIFSTLPYSSYGEMTGTSMATPFVSGALALLKSYKPTASSSQLKQALFAGVDKGNYLNSTSGRLNIAKALDQLDLLSTSQSQP